MQTEKEEAKMPSLYDQVYDRSMRDPEGFWAAAAEDIYWDRRWDRVLDDSRPPYYRWFAGRPCSTPATTRSTVTSTAAAASSSP